MGHTAQKNHMVRFTTKGQVVIPSALRKEFHIEEGTRAMVSVTAEGLLLKPVTLTSIRRARGILAPKAGGKSFAQEMAQYKKEERTLEEVKLARHGY